MHLNSIVVSIRPISFSSCVSFQLRNEINESNLAKKYVRSIIKRYCWDDMLTKGRSLKGFYSQLEVTNYPMRERGKEELDELAFVTQQRCFEKAEEQVRKEVLDASTANNPPLIGKIGVYIRLLYYISTFICSLSYIYFYISLAFIFLPLYLPSQIFSRSSCQWASLSCWLADFSVCLSV